jgi:hypothetical protein
MFDEDFHNYDSIQGQKVGISGSMITPAPDSVLNISKSASQSRRARHGFNFALLAQTFGQYLFRRRY